MVACERPLLSSTHNDLRQGNSSIAARITDDEWDELTPENFDTTALLRAVDAVDVLRDDLNDGEGGWPPQLRTDLLKLHRLAMAVFNEGSRGQVEELFDFAVDLESQIDHLVTHWNRSRKPSRS